MSEMSVNDKIRQNIAKRNEVKMSSTGTIFGDYDGLKERQLNRESFGESVKRGFRSTNAAVGLYQLAERNITDAVKKQSKKEDDEYFSRVYGGAIAEGKANMGIPADPEFRLADHWDEMSEDIPMEFWDDFKGVDSLLEAQMLRGQLLQEQQDLAVLGQQGMTGFTAMAASGILDIDAPLMFMSGGAVTAAKAGRVANSLRAGTAAGATAMGVEGVNAMVRPTVTAQDVAIAGIAGMALGGLTGSFAKRGRKAQEAAMEEAAQGPSVGAMRNYHEPIQSTLDMTTLEKSEDITKATTHWDKANGLTDRINKKDGVVDHFELMLSKTPYLRTDYERGIQSNSPTLKYLVYSTLESATGKVRNNKTASMYREIYDKRIATTVIPEYNRSYDEWAGSQGLNAVSREFDGEALENFGKQVHVELYNRRYNGDATPDIDPSVSRAADAVERGGDEALAVGNGREGETAIAGFADIKKRRGYSPLIVKGNKVKKQYDIHGKEKVNAALGRAYERTLEIPAEDGRAIANAVTRRAIAKNEGVDTNVANLLTSDGREFLREALEESVGRTRTESIMRSIDGDKAEAGKASFAKKRTDIDLRVSDGEIDLFDLVDNDLARVWTRYGRGVSGQAALARVGITSKADQTKMINTILREDPTVDREWLDQLFTHFQAGPLAGGVSPVIRRLKQLTNLALLNGMGVTQQAELGAVVSASGVESFVETAPTVVKKMMKGEAAPEMIQEFEGAMGRIGDEHQLFRDDYAIDESRGVGNDEWRITKHVDNALAKGQRLQGHLSLFYTSRKAQQQFSVMGMANKVSKLMRDNNKVDKGKFAGRMEDIWGNDARQVADYIEARVKDGTIEFLPNGVTDRLNLAKWDPKMVDMFSLGLNRHTDQVVQKTLAGEDSVWMHKDMGAMFTHLRTFPMLAMRKQFIRNARLNDDVTKATWLYALGTAGMVYTAKQILAGKTDRLDAESVALGAFGLSNVTGWIPMWTDPLASMMGLDDLKFNKYGAKYGFAHATLGPLPTPPIIPTFNRLSGVSGAMTNALQGEFSDSDIYALQALPIIGNLYGFQYMFNQMHKEF